MRGLQDRRIVIAGGATGIGAATAERLAAEGATVVVGDIDLVGYALTSRAVIPHFLRQGGGAIVNTGSGAAWGGDPTRPACAASKAGSAR